MDTNILSFHSTLNNGIDNEINSIHVCIFICLQQNSGRFAENTVGLSIFLQVENKHWNRKSK